MGCVVEFLTYVLSNLGSLDAAKPPGVINNKGRNGVCMGFVLVVKFQAQSKPYIRLSLSGAPNEFIWPKPFPGPSGNGGFLF